MSRFAAVMQTISRSLRRAARAMGPPVLGALLFAGAVSNVAMELVPLPARIAVADSVMVEYQDGQPAHVFISEDEKWRIGGELDEIDPAFIAALIQYEDRRFYYHPGVDPIALTRAVAQNLTNLDRISGASTLTMQVVRILEPRPRTLSSKLVEMWRAMQLEAHYDKREILELYVRFAPYGRNIEGTQAASLAYFGHQADHLSPAEIALLVAVPQNPTRRYPHAKNVIHAKMAVDKIGRRLGDYDRFTRKQVDEVVASTVPRQLRPFPRDIPHAAYWMTARMPGETRIKTTLRRDVQLMATRNLQAHRTVANLGGVHNGVVVVLDSQTSDVLALVGNFDFWDNEHGGQVAGFDAPRSPGSALKPFIYAMGIESGLVLPERRVKDLPVRFGLYEPENYDEKYRGLVRLEDALSLSLNVPFVNLLRAVGVDPFYDLLSGHGITTLGDRSRYGLSMAIGAVEVTPLELTNLYATLARDGVYRDYVLVRDEDGPPVGTLVDDPDMGVRRIFSPGVAFLTKRALRRKDRPDFPGRRASVHLAPSVFWKTGTSYGHRDAWAVGGDAQFTVGVWMGNFDARPSKNLVGSEMAGPVLFDVMDGLSNRFFAENEEEAPTDDLIQVDVCAFSGRLPSSACPHRAQVLAPRTGVPTETCPYHERMAVDAKSGHRLCPVCRKGRDYELQSYTVLPTSVRRFMKERHTAMRTPPSHLRSCPAVVAQDRPKIVTPERGTTVVLIPGISPDDQEIPLEVEAAGRETEVFWFVNGKLLERAAPTERVWLTPELGKHTILVTDSAGRSDRVTLRVE